MAQQNHRNSPHLSSSAHAPNSPMSYPSPSHLPNYESYPPPGQSPSNSNLSLPSIAAMNNPQQHMGSNLPPSGAPQYYQNAYPTSDPNSMRYGIPLPADAQRVMSGGRHKKVIQGNRDRCSCFADLAVAGDQASNQDGLSDLSVCTLPLAD